MFTTNLENLNFGESSLERGSGGREMEGNYKDFSGRGRTFGKFGISAPNDFKYLEL
jgi:hypothetical protein